MKLVAYLYTDPLLEPSPDLACGGLEIAQMYHDLAMSIEPAVRRKGKAQRVGEESRSQWQQLIQDCRTAPPDFVILRQLADLGESVQAVSERLAELDALKIPVIVLAELPPTGETLSPLQLGDTPATAMQRLQNLEQQQRSRRIRQGHARNRVQALPPPGKAPYGYHRGKTGYVIDRTTAPVVKDFFEQFLLYGSVRGAVRYLAKRYNKKIAVSTGQRWLTNPVYRGDLAYQDGNRVRDAHPAIISRDEAAQVDRLLRRNQRLPARSASAPRSLAGLVICGDCRSPLSVARVTTHNHQREYLYLRPRACPRTPKCASLPYDEVLQATIQQICATLSQTLAGVDLPDLALIKQGVTSAIAAKQALLAQLPTFIESGILDQNTAALRAYNLRTEIVALQTNLAELPPVDLQATAQTLSIPQFWLDLTETERRAYLREFIREIRLFWQAQEQRVELVFSFMG